MSNVSFKPAYRTSIADTKFYTNNLAFATREEAEESAEDLAQRWTLVMEWRVEESDQPVNYRIENNVLIPVEQIA